MLSPQVPTLVGYLGNQSLTEALLGALVDVSQASPSSLVSFLPPLRILGQQCPAFLAHVAKIHGAVGIISEVKKKQKKPHTLKKEPYLISNFGDLTFKFNFWYTSGPLQLQLFLDCFPEMIFWPLEVKVDDLCMICSSLEAQEYALFFS